jgi:hypothetical protein
MNENTMIPSTFIVKGAKTLNIVSWAIDMVSGAWAFLPWPWRSEKEPQSCANPTVARAMESHPEPVRASSLPICSIPSTTAQRLSRLRMGARARKMRDIVRHEKIFHRQGVLRRASEDELHFSTGCGFIRLSAVR